VIIGDSKIVKFNFKWKMIFPLGSPLQTSSSLQCGTTMARYTEGNESRKWADMFFQEVLIMPGEQTKTGHAVLSACECLICRQVDLGILSSTSLRELQIT
jgi:hypothetical protein